MNIFKIERILRQAKMGTVVRERLGAISVFVDENCENYDMTGPEARMRITRLLRQEGLEAGRRRRR